MNDTTERRSALAVTSLALALLTVLSLIILLVLLYSVHGDTFFYTLLGGGLLSFFITSTGVVVGSIALYRRGIHIGWMGLAGLMTSVVSLCFCLFLLLVACIAYLFKDIALIGFH